MDTYKARNLMIKSLQEQERSLAREHSKIYTLMAGETPYGPQSEAHKSMLKVQTELLRALAHLLLERIKLLENGN